MTLTIRDREILRDLARQIADLAHLPIQDHRRKLWIAHNGLKPVRPMVVIDQIPWSEMDVDGSLRTRVTHGFWEYIEAVMRMTIYQFKYMPGDMVIENRICIPKAIRNTGIGMRAKEDIAVTDPNCGVVGHAYHRQIDTFEDIEKLQMPVVSLDVEETRRREEQAHELFDGILPVWMSGQQLMFAMWDRLIELMGVEQTMVDLYDRPDFIHAVCERYTQTMLCMLDQYEQQGLLDNTINTCHCSYTYNDILPTPGQSASPVKADECWSCGMAQIFVNVGPAMHDEFHLQYAKRFFSRFGFLNYGCCEPLDRKIELIRRVLPNVRKISTSPWADPMRTAEKLGSEVIMARKPNPSFVSGPSFDWDGAKAEIQRTLDACRTHQTPVEFILKDISTLHYRPQRLWDWERRTMELVGA